MTMMMMMMSNKNRIIIVVIMIIIVIISMNILPLGSRPGRRRRARLGLLLRGADGAAHRRPRGVTDGIGTPDPNPNHLISKLVFVI